MAAKISVPVPWPHILESARLPKSLSFNSFFFFWQLPCFGGLLTQNIFFSKLGKLILNFLEHSHTWDDVEREKLSGGLWSKRVLKTILKSRKVPVYPTSRREKKELDDNLRNQTFWETRWLQYCEVRGLGLKFWPLSCWVMRYLLWHVFFGGQKYRDYRVFWNL